MLSKKKNNQRNKSIIFSFVYQLVWKISAWALLGTSLAFFGGFFGEKDFISQDIFGGIYQTLTRSKTRNLQNFFLGEGPTDRQKILFYAIILVGIIIFLSTIVTLINLELKLNDRYIENNKFYLYNSLIFNLNTIVRLLSYVVITLCFISAQTFLLILVFVLLYSWFSAKKLTKPVTENFFTWQDPLIRKLFLYSGLVILILPFLFSRWGSLLGQTRASGGSVPKLREQIQNLFYSIPALRAIFDLLENISGFAHLIILIWPVSRAMVLSRISEYDTFWANVNNAQKQAADFKHFYYYQKLLSEANIVSKKADLPTQTKKAIILGDYNFLQTTPAFLKKKYLEKELNDHEREDILREFSNKIKKIIEFIDFLPQHLNPTGKNQRQQKEVNFLTFCLFNEFQSFAEIKKTKQLILSS
jgi:hypothetical protein